MTKIEEKKNVQVTEEAFSSQKRPSNTSKHELLKIFLLLWVIFALMDPDPEPDSESGSGYTDPIEYGSNPDPDPQPWPPGTAAAASRPVSLDADDCDPRVAAAVVVGQSDGG